MATIKFQTIGKAATQSIYISVSIARGKVYRKNTGLTINKDNWSKATNSPKQTKTPNPAQSKLSNQLEKLKAQIRERLNDAIHNNKPINLIWLTNNLNDMNGTHKAVEVKTSNLINYFDIYTDSLSGKIVNERTINPRTIEKFRTLKLKVEAFQKLNNKQFLINDVNLDFIKEFVKYLVEVESLSSNYAGRLIGFFKTVLIHARLNGYPTHFQIDAIKAFKVQVPKNYLSFADLEKIKNADTPGHLQASKDWLIIGCYVGQRVSDLLRLTNQNLKTYNGAEFIELKQQKTQKQVLIAIHPEVRTILNRLQSFPELITSQKMNVEIKAICEAAKLNDLTEGAIVEETSKGARKRFGMFPKHEIVTSHFCRRSFSTNFYGTLPTSDIISITGHATEKQFLAYVGKPKIEQAAAVHLAWNPPPTTPGKMEVIKKPLKKQKKA